MKIIDSGHKYNLLELDKNPTEGDFSGTFGQTLTFVKRCDLNDPTRFPGNTNAYPGTTAQSVLRALINRTEYLQRQKWCFENVLSIFFLKVVNWLYEFRAARRHGFSYWKGLNYAYKMPLCQKCGHTKCEHVLTTTLGNGPKIV
jgi:hypothetical protein